MEAAFSSQHSAVSQNQHQNQHQNQRPFTAEGAEESKTLPLSHGKPGQVNADEQEQVKEQAEALALKLAQAYEELTRLLERNPAVKRQITEGDARADKVYEKLKQRLKMADMAPRCQWVRQDGTSCRSPQMKQHIYCFAHKQMAQARTLMLMLPAAEDANAIQVGLMRIQKAVIEDTISMKKAGLLLYSMQLALTNVGQTTFGQAKDEEMVRETMDEEEAFSRQQSAISNQQNQHQNQRPFTAKDAEDAKEKKGLPRMDADERGLENPRNPIEWKPTADMYRMGTREGMEAYEANFGTKIKPRVACEPRPLQGLAQPGAEG
jgi:DNA-binding MarR family transcriptional regulator